MVYQSHKKVTAGYLLFFAVAVISFAGSCVTVKEPLPVIAYSDSQSLQYSIQTIEKTAEKDLSLALIQARRLKTENSDKASDQLYAKLLKKFSDNCADAFEKESFRDALAVALSLEALQEPTAAVETKQITADHIKEKIRGQWETNGDGILLVPTLQKKKASDSPEKVSDYIKGTVTVWVNQGMRLQGGVSSPAIAIGSGFFIDPRGYIITNYHVISSEVDPKYEGFSRLFIKMSDDPDVRIPAKVIGWDPVLDLALLKTTVDVPYIFSLGSSSDLDSGDTIYAIGSPAGLERTLTSGIVSADKRRLFSMGSVLQIDAPINHGNSGGPIISREGTVQAIVFAGVENFEGLNFAIPVEYLIALLPRLYGGGKISHAWFGAYGKDVKNVVFDDGSILSGIRVLYVMPTSGADAGGLKEDTIITAINGKPVLTIESLQTELIHCIPGQIVRISTSDGDVCVPLLERPQQPGKSVLDFDVYENAFVPLMGMKLLPLGGRIKPKFSIQKIYSGSIADETGFSEQDPFTLLEAKVDEKAGAVYVRIDVQKRKNGFLESSIGFGLPLDSPDYF